MKKMNKRGFLIFMLGLLLVAAAWVVTDTLFRQLWFDEALTLLEFTSRDTWWSIYLSYAIPNNHIVFNLLLRFFIDLQSFFLPIADFSFRLFPALMALATPLLLFSVWRKVLGPFSAFLVSFCFCLSLPFQINATAIRGYLLSFLLVLAAFELARRWQENNRPLFLYLYFGVAFLAVGTIPSNLLPLLAVGAYFLPECGFNPFSKKFLLLFVLPLPAFLLFYGPILQSFLHVLSLKEGWSNGLAAAYCTYGAFACAVLPLLFFALAGAIWKWRKSSATARLRGSWRFLCLLVPLPVFLILPAAPFPRVFFPFWPLWLFLLGLLVREFFSSLELRRERTACGIFFMGIILCSIGGLGARDWRAELAGTFVKKGGLDDFFDPYYMRSDFKPFTVAIALAEFSKDLKVSPEVFVSFDADPYPLVFYGKFQGVPETVWKYDSPRGKVASLGEAAAPVLLVLRDGELDSVRHRFKLEGKRISLLEDAGFQKLYLAE